MTHDAVMPSGNWHETCAKAPMMLMNSYILVFKYGVRSMNAHLLRRVLLEVFMSRLSISYIIQHTDAGTPCMPLSSDVKNMLPTWS